MGAIPVQTLKARLEAGSFMPRLGCAEGALEIVEYVQERKAFGHSVGSFQRIVGGSSEIMRELIARTMLGQ